VLLYKIAISYSQFILEVILHVVCFLFFDFFYFDLMIEVVLCEFISYNIL